MMLLTLGLKGESKSSSRNYESLEKKVEFSFRNSAKSQFVEFVSINLEICKRGLSTVDHSVAYFKSSWSEFRPAADLSSIPRFLAVACSWVARSHVIGLQIPTKKQDLELPERLEKTRKVVGACKVRLEFLATEVTSLRANERMLHSLPVSSSLFRKREYTVIKKM